MNTLPTAEEWLSNHKELSVHDVASYDEGGYLGVDERALYTIMIEFAKLHVEQALKAAGYAADTKEMSSHSTNERYREMIKQSYPLENIK